MKPIDDVALDVTLLRAFVTLLDERHVTRASQRLGITQSATSHALGRLRRAFGDPLFVRGPRGIVPTERALELGPRVIRVLEDVDALARPAGPFDPRSLQRTFFLGGPDYAELVLLPALSRALAREAPNVDLVFRPSSSDEELERGSLDLAFDLPERAAPRLLKKKLLDEEFVCVLRRGHAALKQPLTVERFAQMRHVLITPRGSTGLGVVDEALLAKGLRRRIAVRTATFGSAPRVVEQTDCIATLPRRIAKSMGRGIVLTPPPMKLPGFTLAMLFHERSRNDPAHQWLRGMLVEVARSV